MTPQQFVGKWQRASLSERSAAQDEGHDPFQKRRPKRLRARKRPDLSIRQILAWADAFHARTGRWPSKTAGLIPESDGNTWNAVHLALLRGSRGLERGSSLARLLAEQRGKRNHLDLPRLTIKQILRWADRHYRRSSDWPTLNSGTVAEAPTETWHNLDAALRCEACRAAIRCRDCWLDTAASATARACRV